MPSTDERGGDFRCGSLLLLSLFLDLRMVGVDLDLQFRAAAFFRLQGGPQIGQFRHGMPQAFLGFVVIGHDLQYHLTIPQGEGETVRKILPVIPAQIRGRQVLGDATR